MKRSKINQCIKEMEALIKEHGFKLPDFVNWTPQDWNNKGTEYDEVRDNMLGWDVTDYGQGDWDRFGLTLLTLRNGNYNNRKYPKPYAEKLLMLKEGQHSSMHFHLRKMEDIINRGGGILKVRLYNDDGHGEFADTEVLVNSDGRSYYIEAGDYVELSPGESITILPHQYHTFQVKSGTGDVLMGEVSMCNDDKNDNNFHEDIGRYPTIEEDEEPYRLLCNEYPIAK